MKIQNVARVYLRASSDNLDLQRQKSVICNARDAGYYVAAIYLEKPSGSRADRPELMRMLKDLQPGEVIIAEKIDRITSLPLSIATKLVDTIRARGALLSVPGIVDLLELVDAASGAAKVALQDVQDMLLRVLLQIARDYFECRCQRQRLGIDQAKMAGRYNGRAPNTKMHERVIARKSSGCSIAETASLSGCSVSQVKRIWAQHLAKLKGEAETPPSTVLENHSVAESSISLIVDSHLQPVEKPSFSETGG